MIREIAKPPKAKEETRQRSWCCNACVIPVQGQIMLPETDRGARNWVPVIVLLCTCGKQMHGREYEGWIADA